LRQLREGVFWTGRGRKSELAKGMYRLVIVKEFIRCRVEEGRPAMGVMMDMGKGRW